LSDEDDELHLQSGPSGGGVGEAGGVAGLDVCTSIESTDVRELMRELVNAVLVASGVGLFVAFVLLALLHVIREVLTEGWQDRVSFSKQHFCSLVRQGQHGKPQGMSL
jgi:hypothetical protein